MNASASSGLNPFWEIVPDTSNFVRVSAAFVADATAESMSCETPLGSEPFFVVNSDSIWIDEGRPALERLRAAWDEARMDCLLLLCPSERTVGYDGQGDFLKDSEGRIIGRARHGEKGLAYIGAYLVHPRLFANVRLSKFSMNLLWDRAIADKRLFGIEHKGLWLHVGTPESIALAEGALKEALTLSR